MSGRNNLPLPLTERNLFSPPPPEVPSLEEAGLYYYGLPSRPRLVARTTTTPWAPLTGPEAYATAKELRPIGDHKDLKKAWWHYGIPQKLIDLLDTMEIKWTSIDAVRIACVGDAHAPAIIWLGVMHKSLSGEKGVKLAAKCKELLLEHGIQDVDCEIRESEVFKSAGPKLLRWGASDDSDVTTNIRIPLTTTLGQPISTVDTPCVEGTLGFFIQRTESHKKLFAVTAAHVVDNRGKDDSKTYHHKQASQSAQKVTLPAENGYSRLLNNIKGEIEGGELVLDLCERKIKAFEGKDNPEAVAVCTKAQNTLDETKKDQETFQSFEREVRAKWDKPENRVLGYTLLSPPIVLGAAPNGYSEDWAIIEVDLDKFDAENFEGNIIDLGTEIDPGTFTIMMNPNPRNHPSFQYPVDRLLRLRDTIPIEELRAPMSLDENGEQCLMVIKRGSTTGLTIGRANQLESFARTYWDDGTTQTSKEWPILPRNKESGAFSLKGDSGAAIADGKGRLGGMLTGGTAYSDDNPFSDTFDITYATPIDPLLSSFQHHGFGMVNLNPELES